MSEDSVTVYKEVFDENSEPTDKGERNMKDSGIDTKHVDEYNCHCMSHLQLLISCLNQNYLHCFLK